jgi:hypothetical protein
MPADGARRSRETQSSAEPFRTLVQRRQLIIHHWIYRFTFLDTFSPVVKGASTNTVIPNPELYVLRRSSRGLA